MAYNHRIYTNEIGTQLTTPIEGTAALQVVVGTAPVNLAADPAAAVNVPIIAYDFPEAQKQLGYSTEFDKYTLCQSMYASFQIFAVAPVIFINVLDPAVHKKAFSKNNVLVSSKAATILDTGIMLDTLAVKDQADVALVKNTDYVAAFNSSGGIDITLLTTEKTVSVTGLNVSADQLDPTLVTEDDIVGGYETATGKETGLELVRQVYPKFGLTPGIIIAPGWSHKATVAAVMCAKTTDINGIFTCETAIDMDTSTKVYTGLSAAKTEIGVISKHAILLWPKVRLGTMVFAYSAIWAAMTAYTDAANGDIPYKSPSNELLNMSAAVLEDGTEVVLDTSTAEVVNSYGIVTAINDGGWKAWGNNTAAYPGTTDPKDRWIACRRMMSWYRNHFILTYKAKVDDPANYRLVEAVVDAENLYLNGLASSGNIAGGIISFNEDENPIESIINGKIVFKTKIAFWTPAEYIVNNIEFDPTIIKTALGGE
ncbi:phage tail sheath family protein [Lacrimispora sp. AGF001]|uniref:phage tail sheath family protein n=1 Tax=Lacrimispora sp. AGF001 TaxID=3401631 RepID=UPI003B4319BD